jgi:hypothetical protein
VGGFTIFGSCMIGVVLIVGQSLFPNHVIMWFASDAAAMDIWRPIILASLLLLAVIHDYYDNVYWRIVWGVLAFVLLSVGADYFMKNPEYVFDAMYILAAGTCFMVASLQPAPDRLVVPKSVESLLPSAAIVYYSRVRKPTLQGSPAWHDNDMRDLSHRLILQRGPQLLKQ